MREPTYLCKDCKHCKMIGVFMGFGTLDIECQIKNKIISYCSCNKFEKKEEKK